MTASAADSPALRAALRARDPKAARQLWEQFAPVVFRVLRRTLGPGEAVDDPAQDVLVRVFNEGPRLRDDSSLFSFVLSAIARVARGHLRRGRMRSADSRRAGPDTDAAEPVLRLYRILKCLSARDQVAFAFHFIDGMEVAQVASALGSSPARTERRLVRAWAKVTHHVARDPLLRESSATAPLH